MGTTSRPNVYSDMAKLSLAVFALFALATAQEPEVRVAKLQRLGCSLDQVIMCEGEISAAWTTCTTAGESWFDCIQDVLGASDCALCVCDVVEWLGLASCN